VIDDYWIDDEERLEAELKNYTNRRARANAFDLQYAGDVVPKGDRWELRRLYREERLQVRRRRGRKRVLGARASMALPQDPNQRWSLDFLSDAMTDSGRFSYPDRRRRLHARMPGRPGRGHLTGSHASACSTSGAGTREIDPSRGVGLRRAVLAEKRNTDSARQLWWRALRSCDDRRRRKERSFRR
jgi:hypothetical protein